VPIFSGAAQFLPRDATASSVVPKPTAISDFRPISVTPLLSRVAERTLVRKWLLPAIPTDMLADQFGFRPSGSTQCALINMLHHVIPQRSRTVIMPGV